MFLFCKMAPPASDHPAATRGTAHPDPPPPLPRSGEGGRGHDPHFVQLVAFFLLRGDQWNFDLTWELVNRTQEGPKNEVFRETYADFAWRTRNGTGRTRKINRGEGPIDFFL